MELKLAGEEASAEAVPSDGDAASAPRVGASTGTRVRFATLVCVIVGGCIIRRPRGIRARMQRPRAGHPPWAKPHRHAGDPRQLRPDAGQNLKSLIPYIPNFVDCS